MTITSNNGAPSKNNNFAFRSLWNHGIFKIYVSYRQHEISKLENYKHIRGIHLYCAKQAKKEKKAKKKQKQLEKKAKAKEKEAAKKAKEANKAKVKSEKAKQNSK